MDRALGYPEPNPRAMVDQIYDIEVMQLVIGPS
jgi:hypothetical protein